MRSRGLWLFLGLALLAASCAEAPPQDLPTPEHEALEAYMSDPDIRRKIEDLTRDHPELAEDYVGAVPGDQDARSTDSDEEAEQGAPARRPGGGLGPPGTFLLVALGVGVVLVVLSLILVRQFRRTGISMDLAVRASRRRYLARCREAARRRADDRSGGMAGHGAS